MQINQKKIKKIFCGIPALLLLLIGSYSHAQNIVVHTQNGYVKGLHESNAYVFKGVPYARPPVGELRFKTPLPPKDWSDTLDATKFGSVAAQSGGKNKMEGSENCLSLNIYTNNTTPQKPQPVLVWVHGGGMTGGAGKGTNGHAFADHDSIVTITINYRLGAFGFLELNDLGKEYKSSGNNAVLDCIAALKWIKQNIQKFGGDPNRITIIGESAGAKLASAVLVTPLSKGLISAAILESGATQCIRDTITAKAIRSKLFAELKIKNPADILSIPAEEIIKAQSKILGGVQGTNYFGPVVDGVVYKQWPLQYIADKQADNIRLLVGTNKSEAKLFMNIDRRLYHPTIEALRDWFGDNGSIIYKRFQEAMKTRNDTMSVAVPLLTQYMYQMHSYRLANAFSNAGYPVKVYRFDFGNDKFGAVHGDELKYVWYVPNKNKKENETDSALIKSVHGDWVHFIKNEKTPGERWPLYKGKNPSIKVYDKQSMFERLKHIYDDQQFPSSCFVLDSKSE